MNTSIMLVGSLFLFLIIKSGEINCSLLFGTVDKCLLDSNCESTAYCDHDFPNPFGKCVKGADDGSLCVRDRYCASKKCSFFKCKVRKHQRDGICKTHIDCSPDQYCKKNDQDEMRCIDRKCSGGCFNDYECISERCHLFSCVKIESPYC